MSTSDLRNYIFWDENKKINKPQFERKELQGNLDLKLSDAEQTLLQDRMTDC